MGLLAHGQEREPRLPSYDDIDKLPYINSVSLRPVAPAPWPPSLKSLLMMCRPPFMRLPACYKDRQQAPLPQIHKKLMLDMAAHLLLPG